MPAFSKEKHCPGGVRHTWTYCFHSMHVNVMCGGLLIVVVCTDLPSRLATVRMVAMDMYILKEEIASDSVQYVYI